MVQLLSGAWRSYLGDIASAASRSILIAAPYIKDNEAAWLCSLLRPGIEVITLANLDREAVSTSALDLAALLRLAQVSPSSRLIGLSNLHAKVFVADEKAAIVTSGNLTRSGLDGNIEYGVLLRQPRIVRAVRKDMLSFAPLGSQVDVDALANLLPLEPELRLARANIDRSPTPDAQHRFDEIMRKARTELASVQLGDRSAHAVFGDAIRFVLAKGPQSTQAIEQEVRQLMPTLCDDNEYFTIKGVRYGKTWKRRLRHAQLHLKRRGILAYSPGAKTWALAQHEP